MGLVIAYFVVGFMGALGLFNWTKAKIKTDEGTRQLAERMPDIILIWHVCMVLFWPIGLILGACWLVSELFKKMLLD